MLMKYLSIILLAAISVFGAACVPSEHPLYKEENLIFDASLLGAWENELVQTRVLVKKAEGKAYDVFILPASSQTATETMRVHLVELKGIRFLDIVPVARKGAPEYGKKNPDHYFARIVLKNDYMGVTPLNRNWLRRMLQEKKAALEHELQGDAVLLKSGTAKMQQFVVKYAEDEGAFPNAMGFLKGKEK